MKNPDGVKAEAALWSDSYLFSGMAANVGMHSSRGKVYNTTRKTNTRKIMTRNNARH